jgi:hypothetical protein
MTGTCSFLAELGSEILLNDLSDPFNYLRVKVMYSPLANAQKTSETLRGNLDLVQEGLH